MISIPARKRAWRDVAIATGLYLAVAAIDRWALGLPYLQYFVDLFSRYPITGTAVRVGGVFALCALQILFFWAAVSSPRRWRIVYLTIFCVAAFVEYGYVRSTGTLMNALDVTVMLASFMHWRDMSGEAVNWLALMPVLLVAITFVLLPGGSSRGMRRFGLVAACTFTIHTAIAAPGYIGRSDTLMTSTAYAAGTTQAFFKTLTVFGWNEAILAATRQPRLEVSYESDRTPDTDVVLVIDEAVRADRLSLFGYERPTTPWLKQLEAEGRLTKWNRTAAAAFFSQPSVVSILLGLNLPSRNHELETYPTLFQYAKAMHYETHLFDGQVSAEPWGLTHADMRFVDDFRNVRHFGSDYDTDRRIGAAVRKALDQPHGQFIVVIKRGNHFPYWRNFPESERHWTSEDIQPTLEDHEVIHGVQQTRFIDWKLWGGPYDDGLRYNIDAFFRAVLNPDGSLPGAVLLYTADHGQPYSPKTNADFLTATTVPLLMVGDERPVVDSAYPASHHNIFATVLDLMNYPKARRPVVYSRSLIAATAEDRDARLVFDGDPFGVDTHNVTDYDEILRQESQP